MKIWCLLKTAGLLKTCNQSKLIDSFCLDGGMVDTGDLKSPGSNTVRVRVPLRAYLLSAVTIVLFSLQRANGNFFLTTVQLFSNNGE